MSGKLTKVSELPAKPGEWQKLDEMLDVDADYVRMFPIIICCPSCGKLSSVYTKIHQVEFHEDGTFSALPSFVCPHSPCTWHVFIKHCEH